MAGASSRLGCGSLVRISTRRILSESLLWPVLGESGGLAGDQGVRPGSIRRATFVASSADWHALFGSENSCRTRTLPGVKTEVKTISRTPSQTTYGSLGLSQTLSSLSTGPAPHGRLPIFRSAADGSRKVIARISNTPKFVFKSDLLRLLKGCSLTPEDIMYIYDSKYRVKFIQLELPSVESFQLAQRSIGSKGRFGGRYLRLTSEDFEMDDINKGLSLFRGRSLLMVRVPLNDKTEVVERFFSGYTLDCNYPIKFLRGPVPGAVVGNQGSMAQTKTEIEMRALVRFRTELEALRALREKQGAICGDKPTDLRFIS